MNIVPLRRSGRGQIVTLTLTLTLHKPASYHTAGCNAYLRRVLRMYPEQGC